MSDIDPALWRFYQENATIYITLSKLKMPLLTPRWEVIIHDEANFLNKTKRFRTKRSARNYILAECGDLADALS